MANIPEVRRYRCPECQGYGVVHKDGYEVECANCKGIGTAAYRVSYCRVCGGAGWLEYETNPRTKNSECSYCKGTGRVTTRVE